MKLRIPHTYTLIFLIIALMAVLTYIVPSGEFNRVDDEKTGKTLVVAGSYHSVDANHQGVKQLLMAPINGMKGAAGVMAFVLIIGGAFGIITKTGAIEAGLSRAVRGIKGKGILVIPIAMLLFGLGGSSYGMCEETVPFYMIFIPLMLAMGYDSLTGFMIVLLGAGVGVASSTINPFSVGIAQAIAEIAPGSGIDFRVVQFIIFMSIAIAFVMWHAIRVKKNPKKSAVYELDIENRDYFLKNISNADKLEFNWRHILVLLGFATGIVVMIYNVIKNGWYLEEISMVFLAIGLFAGIAGGLKEKEIAQSFVNGCKDLVYAAVVIGLARGILVITQDGKIIDTMLNSAANLLNGLPKGIFTTAMLFIQNLVAILVPSSSGQAALTMPIMAPLGDLMGINRQVTVTAYQYGTGITNLVTPTAGTLMAALGIARIPWGKWVKFIMPFILILFVVAAVFLVVGLQIYA